MSWPVGTIVVCVDASGTNGPGMCGGIPIPYMARPLVEGEYYTIRKTGVANFLTGDDLPAVWLNEIVRVYAHPDGRDAPFGASRFRKAEGGACESERARQMSEVRV